VTLLLAFAGLGPRLVVERIRERVPLIALGVYWVVGAIATARGIKDYGFSKVLHDVGLLEYSIILVVVALVVSGRREATWMQRSLSVAGAIAIVLFAFATVFGREFWPFNWATIGSAATSIYIALYICDFGSRALHGRHVRAWEWALTWAGLVLIILTYSRAAWLTAVVTLLAFIVMAPRVRRLAVVGIGTVLLATAWGAAVGAEKAQISGDAAELRAAAEALEGQTLAKREIRSGDDGRRGGGGGDGDIEIPPEVRETFSNNISHQSNSRWRLAIWKFQLERTAEQPLFGVGFGRPTRFYWSSKFYDARVGATGGADVSAPHNSFVNITFRTGLLGIGAMIAMVAIAIRRVWPWLRDTESRTQERTTIVGLVALLLFITGIASLNVSLEGPFMGIFFWTVLGLLLVIPKLYGTPPASALRPDPS
jgi:O-antigen ligase